MMNRGRFSIALAALVATAYLAGCVGPGTPEGETVQTAGTDAPVTPSPDSKAPATKAPEKNPPTLADTISPSPLTAAPVASPQVVVALIDTGINPYHLQFRDSSPLARAHPSTYISGYPAEAQALHLTLDAATLDEALKADAEVWKSVKKGELYWVPGTRVIGMVSVIQDGDHAMFDDNGHGTMTASRAAGLATGLAPEARVVAIEGLTSDSVVWAGKQSWIDVQSNSWIDLVPLTGTDAERIAFGDAAKSQVVFAATGNGLAQMYGGVGQPATVAATSGTNGVIAVGGHDNGQLTPWSGTVPHVVADACWNWAADAKSLDKTSPRIGTGTSSASPYAAGEAAALILEARRMFGDALVSHEGGVLARGAEGLVPSGPLADGDLTLDELKLLLFRTADPTLATTPHDGEACDATMAPYFTAPGAPPSDGNGYYYIGYGTVSVNTLAKAKLVLAGSEALPERAAEDQWYAMDSTARGIFG